MNKKLLASIHYDPNEYLLQTCIAELDGNKVKVISVNHLKVDDFI